MSGHGCGPTGSWLFGAARALHADPLGSLLGNAQRYGDVVVYPVGPRPLQRRLVAFHHPDQIRTILTDVDVFGRHTRSFKALREFFGTNLVTSEGDDWQAQRTALRPMFAARSVAHLGPALAELSRGLLDRELPLAEGADVTPMLRRYAMGALCLYLFPGIDDLHRAYDELDRLVPAIGTAVPARANALIALPTRWPTPANRRFRAVQQDAFAQVTAILRTISEHATTPVVFERLGGTGAAELTDDDLAQRALVFLLAGYTTTTAALSFTLHFLASTKSWQERIAEEASERDDADRPIARAAVLEAIRLYPPSFMISRSVSRPVHLAGVDLDHRDTVVVSPWVTQRDPNLWPDPTTYDPARFLQSQRPAAFSYLPFGGGPRYCIGEHLSLLEASTFVSEICHRFEFERAYRELSVRPQISLRPDGPVTLISRSRVSSGVA